MATTFYAQQAANRRRSLALLLAVATLLGLFGFALGFGLSGYLAGGIAATVLALMVAGGMAAITYQKGDALVLAASRAREVSEAEQPELLNVVRELAIAADVPMPRVHVIEDSAPNAFATGRSPEHASIAVTSGLLEKLDREELQGVIGHELSHVRNLDIRFALLVGVLVGSILARRLRVGRAAPRVVR